MVGIMGGGKGAWKMMETCPANDGRTACCLSAC